MNKEEWIEAHLSELQNIQTLPKTVGALAFAELSEEFFYEFGESLLENLEK